MPRQAVSCWRLLSWEIKRKAKGERCVLSFKSVLLLQNTFFLAVGLTVTNRFYLPLPHQLRALPLSDQGWPGLRQHKNQGIYAAQ